MFCWLLQLEILSEPAQGSPSISGFLIQQRGYTGITGTLPLAISKLSESIRILGQGALRCYGLPFWRLLLLFPPRAPLPQTPQEPPLLRSWQTLYPADTLATGCNFCGTSSAFCVCGSTANSSAESIAGQRTGMRAHEGAFSPIRQREVHVVGLQSCLVTSTQACASIKKIQCKTSSQKKDHKLRLRVTHTHVASTLLAVPHRLLGVESGLESGLRPSNKAIDCRQAILVELRMPLPDPAFVKDTWIAVRMSDSAFMAQLSGREEVNLAMVHESLRLHDHRVKYPT